MEYSVEVDELLEHIFDGNSTFSNKIN